MIPSHELKTLYCPYSAVDNNLVKIGVVIVEMPLCRNAQIRNQKDALTWTGSDLYLFINLLIINISSNGYRYSKEVTNHLFTY